MAWTEERVKKLTLLWKSGNSASKIAVELGEGVSRNAVIGKIHRLGLSERGSGLGTKGTKKSSKHQSDNVSTADKSSNDLILDSISNNLQKEKERKEEENHLPKNFLIMKMHLIVVPILIMTFHLKVVN